MQMDKKEIKSFEAGDMADPNVSAGANQSIHHLFGNAWFGEFQCHFRTNCGT
jgi:hypothetical protein